MIWGAMTATGVSPLHILPPNQNVNALYYQENILEPFLLHEVHRAGDRGPVTKRKFHENTLALIFQQGGAPANTAFTTQNWLQNNFLNFWDKSIWPPNFPDLPPIENLWATLKDKVNRMEPQPSTIEELKRVVEDAWSKISPDTLENLISSMPDRINAVIKAKGFFPSKYFF